MFSVANVVSDFLLVYWYMDPTPMLIKAEFKNSSNIWNSSVIDYDGTRTCIPVFSNLSSGYITFSCSEVDFVYGMSTLAFVIAPSGRILGSMIGLQTAAMFLIPVCLIVFLFIVLLLMEYQILFFPGSEILYEIRC